MKRFTRLSLSLILCLTLVLGIVPITGQAAGFTATTEPFSSRNKSDQDYSTWASVVQSYLFENSTDGYTRLEYDADNHRIYIETYDDNLQFTSGKYMAGELDTFGGAYKNSKYYFLAFGQENPNESNNKEVIRIVKYNLKWERLGAASVYGANTTIPFWAGSARFAESNGYLFVHTSHKMYTWPDDGLRHQANMTLTVKISDMTLTESCHNVSAYAGYTSHSFNQFILAPNGKITTLDHGDAYPRAFRVLQYQGTAGTNKLSSCQGNYIDLFSFYGEIGDNATGASVGGFEYSNSSFLVAGNTTPQASYDPYGQRNIFVSTINRSQFNASGTGFRWLTSFASDANMEVSTPHLVKLGSNSFLLLWTENRTILRYVFLDGEGNTVGSVSRASGALSDCKPIVSDGKVIWYVTSRTGPCFYVLDTETKKVTHEHSFKNSWSTYPTYDSSGYVKQTCIHCDQTLTLTAPAYRTDPNAYIATPETEGYPNCTSSGILHLDFKACPVDTISINHPQFGHDHELVSSTQATCTEDGVDTYTCTRCQDSYTEVTPAPGHQFVTGVRKPNCFWEGRTTHRCTVCNYTYYTDYQPKTEHEYIISSSVAPTCETDGTNTTLCINCGDCYNVIVPATGHSYTSEITKAATCSQEGIKTFTCSVCGDSYTEAIPATGQHNYSSRVIQPSTCGNSGRKLYTCPACGDYYYEDLPATGKHIYTSQVTQEATCSQEGVRTFTCSVCGDSYTEAIPATGHSYKNGICTGCGDGQLPGDMNGDSKLNVLDVALLYAHTKGTGQLTAPGALTRADVNGDGKVNVLDVALLYATVKG